MSLPQAVLKRKKVRKYYMLTSLPAIPCRMKTQGIARHIVSRDSQKQPLHRVPEIQHQAMQKVQTRA